MLGDHLAEDLRAVHSAHLGRTRPIVIDELAAEADVKAAGLTFIKTITHSPTAIDLTTQLTGAKEAGIKTLLPTGFTGIPAMVAGIKQIGWSPTVIGWGDLYDYDVTASQVPPGTVDGCDQSYAPG